MIVTKSPDFDKVFGVTETEICEEDDDEIKLKRISKVKVTKGIMFIGAFCGLNFHHFYGEAKLWRFSGQLIDVSLPASVYSFQFVLPKNYLLIRYTSNDIIRINP